MSGLEQMSEEIAAEMRKLDPARAFIAEEVKKNPALLDNPLIRDTKVIAGVRSAHQIGK